MCDVFLRDTENKNLTKEKQCRRKFDCVKSIMSKIVSTNKAISVQPLWTIGGMLNYLSHRSSGPQYELICIQPIRDRAYSFAYSQSTAGDSTLGIY